MGMFAARGIVVVLMMMMIVMIVCMRSVGRARGREVVSVVMCAFALADDACLFDDLHDDVHGRDADAVAGFSDELIANLSRGEGFEEEGGTKHEFVARFAVFGGIVIVFLL